jgi:hypothetical protein
VIALKKECAVANVVLKRVTKKFDDIVAVDGVNLEVADREFIVLAAGFKPEEELKTKLQELKGKASSPQIFDIGDCHEVRDNHGPIHDGYKIGIKI